MIMLGRLNDATAVSDEPVISAATLAEPWVGLLLTDDEAEQSARLAHLQRAESDSGPWRSMAPPLEHSVGWRLPSDGRKPAARACDALIAATAIAAAVYLHPRDFQGIPDLDLISTST